MAKRRNNVTANNANAAAPKKEQATKPVRKNRPAPPAVKEEEVEEEFFDEEDLLTEEEMEEMEAEVKPSLWTRIKESKPVQIGKKVVKIGAFFGAGYLLHEAVDKIRGNGSSDEDNCEVKYDDDSTYTE